MKTYLTKTVLLGLLSFLFSCKQPGINKDALYGSWEAIRLDGKPINTHGFTSIKMKITPDSIYITTQMKTFGDVTTESEGSWELTGNGFKSKIGEGGKESNIYMQGSNLIFTPDPLFKQEAVSKSEYQRVE